MKSVYITGYKPFELNIFKNDEKEVKMIQLYFEDKLKQYIDEGLEWVIISGQLGIELWVAEVVIRMKKQYPIKLAIIPPFLNHDEKWNDVNKLYYSEIKSLADFVTSTYDAPYDGGYMFREATQFILNHTEGTIIFYDEINEASPKYTMQALIDFTEKNNYNMDIVTFDDLMVFINDYNDNRYNEEVQ